MFINPDMGIVVTFGVHATCTADSTSQSISVLSHGLLLTLFWLKDANSSGGHFLFKNKRLLNATLKYIAVTRSSCLARDE